MSEETRSEPVPRHVAVIMDGNGRWAKKRRLGRVRGHREGIAAVRAIIAEAAKVGVRYLTLFTFSTENWGRPGAEVKALMSLLASSFDKETQELVKKGVRVRVIGDRSKLPVEARAAMERSEAATAACDRLTLVLAISYGGRDEILHAVRSIVTEGVPPERIDEECFKNHLYAPDVPDPDLLIRTSGENRISNFLLWQLAYTEIYITEVLWPDFSAVEFHKALEAYGGRKRRFGLTDEQLGERG